MKYMIAFSMLLIPALVSAQENIEPSTTTWEDVETSTGTVRPATLDDLEGLDVRDERGNVYDLSPREKNDILKGLPVPGSQDKVPKS
jgi:hypothetical protein